MEETQLKIDVKDGRHVCFKFVPAVKTYSGVKFSYWKEITHKEYGDIKAQNGLIRLANSKVVKDEKEEKEGEE